MATGRTEVVTWLAASALALAGCGLDQRGTAPHRAVGASTTTAGAGGAATTTGAGGGDTTTTGAGGTSAAGGAGGTTAGSGGTGGATTGTGGSGGVTTGSGGTGGATTGAGGTGGATTTTPTPTEDCFNGKDDDKNGLVDCADPACEPYASCVDEPVGWKLVRFASAPYPDPAAVQCPDGSNPDVFFAQPSAAGCATCACSYTGASCSAPKISCWYDQITCWFGSSFDRQAENDACVTIDVPKYTSLSSCQLSGDPYVVSPGTCSAVGDGLAPAAPWAIELHVCPVLVAQKGGGCGGAQVCAAKPAAAPYGGPLCVQRDGSDDCPAGFTETSTAAYDGADDTRACSACSCDPKTVKCSGGGYHAMDENNCTGGSTWVGNGDCTGTSGELDWNTGSLKPVPATPSAGTCTGATPSGNVTPEGPRKLCCQAP